MSILRSKVVFIVQFSIVFCAIYVVWGLLTLSVNTTPNFQIWYLMSMDVALKKDTILVNVHWNEQYLTFVSKICTVPCKHRVVWFLLFLLMLLTHV